MLRLWRATINTRNGLAFAIRSEQAVREELFALALSVPLAWLVGATVMRRVELGQRDLELRFTQGAMVPCTTANFNCQL